MTEVKWSPRALLPPIKSKRQMKLETEARRRRIYGRTPNNNWMQNSDQSGRMLELVHSTILKNIVALIMFETRLHSTAIASKATRNAKDKTETISDNRTWYASLKPVFKYAKVVGIRAKAKYLSKFAIAICAQFINFMVSLSQIKTELNLIDTLNASFMHNINQPEIETHRTDKIQNGPTQTKRRCLLFDHRPSVQFMQQSRNKRFRYIFQKHMLSRIRRWDNKILKETYQYSWEEPCHIQKGQ